MKRAILLILICCAAPAALVKSQSPALTVAPATTVTSARTTTAVTAAPADLSATLKELQQMKTANDQLIQRQTAMLQHLDELQQGAQQLRVFSSRR